MTSSFHPHFAPTRLPSDNTLLEFISTDEMSANRPFPDRGIQTDDSFESYDGQTLPCSTESIPIDPLLLADDERPRAPIAPMAPTNGAVQEEPARPSPVVAEAETGRKAKKKKLMTPVFCTFYPETTVSPLPS